MAAPAADTKAVIIRNPNTLGPDAQVLHLTTKQGRIVGEVVRDEDIWGRTVFYDINPLSQAVGDSYTQDFSRSLLRGAPQGIEQPGPGSLGSYRYVRGSPTQWAKDKAVVIFRPTDEGL